MINNFLNQSFKPKDEIENPYPKLTALLGKTPITIYIILINVIIYMVCILLEEDPSNNWKFGSLDFSIVTIHNEYYRFIAACFLHGSMIHISLNMFSLFMVGTFIEHIFGKVNFFILYMASAIISTTTSFYITLSGLADSVDYPGPMEAVGASGAIFGIVGGLTFFMLVNKDKINTAVRKRLLINLFTVISLNIAFGLFSGLPIDNAGHIGGLIGGFLVAGLLRAEILGKKKQPLASIIAIFFSITLAVSFLWATYNYIANTRHSESMLMHYFQ